MIWTVASIGAAFSLAGCANSVLTVEQPYVGDQRFADAELVAGESSVDIDADNRVYTGRKLDDALFGGNDPIFAKGDALTIRWRYIGFNEGSRVGRYLTAGFSGSSKVILEVEFVDATGAVLSTVRSEGSVNGGIGGGSNKSGIDKAIEKVAKFAADKFGIAGR